jgi:hypothetical protein
VTLIRFDECLSYRIVDAIRAMGHPPEFDVEHPNDRGQSGMLDVDWIPEFAARGGRCVVSGDPKMRGRIAERAALQAAGFTAIFPPRKGWYDDLRRYGQAAYLLRWFPTIMHVAANEPLGDHFRLPPTFDVEAGKIERLSKLPGF